MKNISTLPAFAAAAALGLSGSLMAGGDQKDSFESLDKNNDGMSNAPMYLSTTTWPACSPATTSTKTSA